MCARKLVVIHPDGSSPMLEQVSASDEEQLQEQLKNRPELLPLEDLEVAAPIVVVGRETPLASGRVDLVGLGRTGDLLLIEFKTGPENADFRHALAQLVDYGSDLWGMDLEEFEAAVALRYLQSDRCPVEAAGRGAASLASAVAETFDEQNAEVSWSEQLSRSLRDGTFKYVLVAQRFTPSILRTIRYLNATHVAEFYAVEMIRFAAPEGALGAFEARVVVAPEPTSRSSSATALAGIDALLEQVADPDYRNALEQFLDAVRGLDVTIYMGSTGVSLRGRNPKTGDSMSLGWIFPPGPPRWMGLANVTLGYWIGEFEDDFQAALDEYVADIAAISGATLPGTKKIAGSTFDPDAVKMGHAKFADALARFVERVSA